MVMYGFDPRLGRQRQANLSVEALVIYVEFQATKVYIVRPCLKMNE